MRCIDDMILQKESDAANAESSPKCWCKFAFGVEAGYAA